MNPALPLPSPAKEDRNTHEVSGDEARPAETRQDQASGGGHRSGSRGVGTFENSDGQVPPREGPEGQRGRASPGCGWRPQPGLGS
jgi:hypothetical protein